MICYVFKPKGSRVFRGRYRLGNGRKIYDVPLRTHIKEVAEEKLRRFLADEERELAGIIAPKALRDGAQRPVSDHCADFLADLTARNRTKEHLKHVQGRLKKLCKECRWHTLRDITAESFSLWRSRQSSHSAKTLNEYLGHANALVNWMVRQGRAASNPLKAVHNLEKKETFHRRALSMEELMRLVKGSRKNGLPYLFAGCTGLRRGEMKQIHWNDIHLGIPQPFIDVRAEITKSKKPATIPLVPMLADALQAAKVRGEKHFSGLVFPRGVPEVHTLAKDLVACGIPVEDERGFRVDFHAFRHTFASLLAAAGVSELARVKLARHSEWKMTDRYTDPRSIPLFGEMQKLAGGFPAPLPSQGASQNSGKTGQNEGISVQPESPNNSDESETILAVGAPLTDADQTWENSGWRRGGDSNPR